MAANFWTSSHRALLISPEQVCGSRGSVQWPVLSGQHLTTNAVLVAAGAGKLGLGPAAFLTVQLFCSSLAACATRRQRVCTRLCCKPAFPGRRWRS